MLGFIFRRMEKMPPSRREVTDDSRSKIVLLSDIVLYCRFSFFSLNRVNVVHALMALEFDTVLIGKIFHCFASIGYVVSVHNYHI